jgi:hypothetical protein
MDLNIDVDQLKIFLDLQELLEDERKIDSDIFEKNSFSNLFC